MLDGERGRWVEDEWDPASAAEGLRGKTLRRSAAGVAASLLLLGIAAFVLSTTLPGGRGTRWISLETQPSQLRDLEGRSQFIKHIKETLRRDASDMVEAMNFSVDPCDNFYEFSCGRWIEQASLHEYEGRVDKSWNFAQASVREALRKIMEATYPADSQLKKISDYYNSCMNMTAIELEGHEPIKPFLNMINSLNTTEDLQELLAEFWTMHLTQFFMFDVRIDLYNHSKYSLYLTSHGISLDDISYYDGRLNNGPNASDPRSLIKIRARNTLVDVYMHIAKLIGYTDKEEAEEQVSSCLQVESWLAQCMSDEDFQERLEKYGMNGIPSYTLTELETEFPNLPWRLWMNKMKVSCRAHNRTCMHALEQGLPVIHIHMPMQVKKLSARLGSHPVEYWKPYLRIHLVKHFSTVLGGDFLETLRKIRGKMYGVPALPPRSNKCSDGTEHALPELTQHEYDRLYLSDASREEAWRLLKDVYKAFLRNLQQTEWMDDSTIKLAVEKAKKIALNVGGPSLPEQAPFRVDPSDYFGNVIRSISAHMVRQALLLDRPVDPHRWVMLSTQVNAQYNNGVNAMFASTAILQEPLFSHDYVISRNFGSIGAIMGHELTHGFDDMGSTFNSSGGRDEWWSTDSRTEFNTRADCLKNLFNGFTFFKDGTHVRGQHTLGENIADAGGLKVALMALNSSLEQSTAEDREDAHRTFFTSYGQLWCSKARELSTQMNIEEDVHAPGPFRANGAVSQNEDFARVFQCPPGSPMNPLHRCTVW